MPPYGANTWYCIALLVTSTLGAPRFEGPEWVEPPQDQKVSLGEDVTLHCRVHSVPEADIEWSLDGTNVLNIDRINYHVSRNGDLKIKDLEPDEIGLYECEATNDVTGETVAWAANVDLKGVAPHILTPLRDVTVDEGGIAHISCSADGEPKPKISWFKDGTDLTTWEFGTHFFIMSNGDLEIRGVTTGDAGDYECRAINEFGMVASAATVEVLLNLNQLKE